MTSPTTPPAPSPPPSPGRPSPPGPGAGLRAVVLPGTGSDGDFAGRALGPALRSVGAVVEAVDPAPGGVVAGYHRALDDAAARGPVLVAGISLGAVVGVRWAAANPGAAAGLVLALPPWTGPGAGSPAALSARSTADAVSRDGLDAVLEAVRTSAPGWLHAELARAWRAQRTHLVAALREAAAVDGPTPAELGGLVVPVGLAAALDDPVHPAAVARGWARHLPRAVVGETDLAAVGADPGELGRVAVAAWLRAGRQPTPARRA